MWLDIRLAWRALRRSPTFAVTAILTLAIGIGSTTAIFTTVHAVLLRPLPFHEPGRLVRIWESRPDEGRERSGISAANATDWQRRSKALEGLALFTEAAEPTVLGVGGVSLQARQTVVTPNFFPLLGVRPVAGSGFRGIRAAPGPLEGTSVVLSHSLWQRAFGGDAGVIGRTVRIEGAASSEIVGVMPPGFAFPSRTEFWTPLDLDQATGRRRNARLHGALARLRPGVSIRDARRDLQSAAAVLARDYPATNAGWTVALMPLHDSLVGTHRLGLVALFAAVALLMLVGCANISNLLLARGVARRGELAVRTALGASRARIARLLLTESCMLAGLGGAAGWAMAGAMLPLLVRLAGENVPRLAEAQLSIPALICCAAATLCTACVAGLLPALRLSRANPHAATAPDGERSTRVRIDTRLQRMVVAGELALCLMLLVGATLFIQTFARLKGVDLGFDPAQVISIDARVPIYRTLAPNRWQVLATDTTAVLQRLQSIPGVQAVSATSDVPLSGNLLTTDVTLAGSPSPRQAFYHRVSPGYFGTMGMTLVQGRDFTDDDASNLARLANPRAAPPQEGAVIVNETTARAFWPSGNALGQFLSTSFDATISRRRVVGVVRDVRSEALRRAAPAEVYVPYLEDPSFAMTLLVRTELPVDRIVPTLRREMREVIPDLSTANIRMLHDVVSDAMGSSRFRAFVVSALAAAALLLCAIGVFGVCAFGVAVRVHEIGIRTALGATRQDIVRMFLRQAAGSICVGVLGGAAGALALGQLIGALLFGVAPTDMVSFAAAALVLVVVAVAASYLPVRRAVRMDPATALRF